MPTAPPDAPAGVIRILLDVTTALTSSLDLDQVLGEMLTRTVRLGRATAGTLMLVDGAGKPQRKIAVRNGMPYQVDDAALTRVLHGGLAGWVFGRGVPAKVDDTLEDPRWLRIDNNGQSSRSAVCVPVWRRRRILAILTLTHSRPHHFDEDVVELLEAIAGQAGIAIENAQLFGEVQRLATTDALTNLANRRHFLALAEAAFARRPRPYSVVMLDVDHFKSFNDAHGHLVGDVVLAEVARRVRDAAGEGALVGRFGGEEFAVALPGVELDAARAAAERIRAAVAASAVATERGELGVTVSVGVADDGGASALEDVLRRADDRLYEAKHEGRDRVVG
ncbi:MAG: sensor domain-containing diguanylate cyclase [Polyangiales bacterium]